MNIQSIDDINDRVWFRQSIESLENDTSLSAKAVEKIISYTIADYVVGAIGILDLLEFADALKKSKAKLTPDLKYIVSDLSALHKHKHDKQFVHNILIDVLRKVTKT